MIGRDLPAAAQRQFDLLVIGGGIYGVSVLREATLRGPSACLCEAGDFGGGTSQNSLRILHGGLRYLQTLDLRRFWQSVAARREIALRFPTLVRPLRCLMPLYGQGMKRTAVMRGALAVNDALSARRNDGLPKNMHLPQSEILGAEATRLRFPQVREAGLEGAAAWSDYFMISSERILMESLHDAGRHGAIALNQALVEGLVVESGTVQGVTIRDRQHDTLHTLRARAVVNCTGPAVRALAQGCGGDANELFRPSLAFNLLFDVPLPCDSAVAVAAPRPDAPMLFLIPQAEGTLAGTWHAPRPLHAIDAQPTAAEIETYLDHIRMAIPEFHVQSSNIRRVFAGLLPARNPMSVDLTKREVLVDHGAVGGVRRFYSVAGVKYTTSSDVARQVLDCIKPGSALPAGSGTAPLPTVPGTELLVDAGRLWTTDPDAIRETLQTVIANESVTTLDDLIFRRTNWATTAVDLDRIRHRILELEFEGIRQ